MPSPLGGIGQQVADNLFELGKSTVQSVAKTPGDLAQGTMEQLTGSPNGVVPQPDQKNSSDQAQRDQQVAISKEKDKQKYQQVKSELEQYRQRKQQLDAQIAREKNQQEQEKQQKEAVQKREKESFVQSLLKKVGAGSHGETDRQKE